MELRPGVTTVDPADRGWRVTASRTGYENPWLRVREDEVVRPDGSPGLYGVVELARPAVFVVALTDDDEVLMVSQYRYAPRVDSLEVPAGGTDDDEPLHAARRELLEETGYVARSWTRIGGMDALNGIADAPEHVYLARGLEPAADRTVTDREQALEGITDVRAVPWDELMGLVRAGQVRDAETLGSLLLAAVHLGRLG